jgi:hypothetical protein
MITPKIEKLDASIETLQEYRKHGIAVCIKSGGFFFPLDIEMLKEVIKTTMIPFRHVIAFKLTYEVMTVIQVVGIEWDVVGCRRRT